ncbi:MAG: type I restriction enzyme M protein [Thalassomonas sp.]|jgi:type I restriction enzyme M protein
MANERKTETIVRNHFNQFLSDITLEEQKSDNAIINKLLKTASKKGTGQGYPEFIISYNTESDLVIVIECKADFTKHESKTRDKYADYAVDGALLYASYLAKSFDVLAIAVSGETKRELKVSNFLHLKGERIATEIFDDKLLSVDEYLTGYLGSPEKLRQDYKSLLDYTKKLNKKLHTDKIPGHHRALLISGVLISLENKAFKKSYASHSTAKTLAKSLTQTISDMLEGANITGEKLQNLNHQFGFINTDTSLSQKVNVLKDLIDDIEVNINRFRKNHEYYDVLSQLYIEFLRYANSDKSLGIVLTPPHITELFAELAQVNKNSIVFDNCTGTGGFLIGAMNKMIIDAKGDKQKEKEIKSEQLIGVEYSSQIYALGVSNMYIHQDGKTNIFKGSCFDKNIITQVKAKKPNIGFLNPPYKSDKVNDADELEFILNNVSSLQDGGTCIAIIPLSCVLAKKGKGLFFKQELLKHHTLEAVLSMPNELFINSKVAVVSCIVVLKAHKAHPKGKETFFAYCKDDGFVKSKVQGRFDANGEWNDIKDNWLTAYFNKTTIPGFSVNKVIKPDDEWCAEAFLETNYSNLNEDTFISEIKKYVAFKVLNQ